MSRFSSPVNFKRFRIVSVLSVLFLCCVPGTVNAQFSTGETELVFSGMQTSTLQRTFTIKGNPLPAKLSFTRHDLVDQQTKVVLLTEQIAVVSTRNETNTEELVRVTITAPGKAGHYTGVLEIADASVANASPVKVQLDVTFSAAPAVEADISSKSLTLKTQQPFYDLPFWGEPRPRDNANNLPGREVFLVQTAESPASVNGATVVGMKGTKDIVLPAGIVAVVQQFPLSILPGAAAPLKIVSAGENVEAGEYNGSLHVWVTDQKAPVQIPIKLLVKDGPLLPLLILIAGLLAAALFGWWNAKGEGVREIIRSIDVLANSINDGQKLQRAEREEATRLLRIAMESIEAGEAVAEIRKKYDAANTYVDTARAAATKFIVEKAEPLISQAEGIAPGEIVQTSLVKSIKDLKEGVLAGRYESLETAEQILSNPLKGLDKQVKIFQNFAQLWQSLPKEKKVEVATKMDAATSLSAIRQVLVEAGLDPPIEPGLAFLLAAEPMEEKPVTSVQLSLKRKLQLSLGAAAVAVIVFIFILVVGWISIYSTSDTFGANPMDYITLFLWGATAEAVRGQTISLTGLKTVVQTKP